MATKRDYYDILGVSKSASPEEIKKAYRKLALEHHPDRHGGDDSKFKEIGEAYETLKDEKKRVAYDQFGHAGAQGNPFAGGNPFGGGGGAQGFGAQGFEGFDFGDILNQFMGGAGGPFGTAQRSGPPRGRDLEVSLTLEFHEAATPVRVAAKSHACSRPSLALFSKPPPVPPVTALARYPKSPAPSAMARLCSAAKSRSPSKFLAASTMAQPFAWPVKAQLRAVVAKRATSTSKSVSAPTGASSAMAAISIPRPVSP
jgi:hypothetical protein